MSGTLAHRKSGVRPGRHRAGYTAGDCIVVDPTENYKPARLRAVRRVCVRSPRGAFAIWRYFAKCESRSDIAYVVGRSATEIHKGYRPWANAPELHESPKRRFAAFPCRWYDLRGVFSIPDGLLILEPLSRTGNPRQPRPPDEFPDGQSVDFRFSDRHPVGGAGAGQSALSGAAAVADRSSGVEGRAAGVCRADCGDPAA